MIENSLLVIRSQNRACIISQQITRTSVQITLLAGVLCQPPNGFLVPKNSVGSGFVCGDMHNGTKIEIGIESILFQDHFIHSK